MVPACVCVVTPAMNNETAGYKYSIRHQLCSRSAGYAHHLCDAATIRGLDNLKTPIFYSIQPTEQPLGL